MSWPGTQRSDFPLIKLNKVFFDDSAALSKVLSFMPEVDHKKAVHALHTTRNAISLSSLFNFISSYSSSK